MNSPNIVPTPDFVAKDRRRYPRQTVMVPIELLPEGSDVFMRLETTDLSRGGCYVKIANPLKAGIRVQATLRLGSDSIVVRGRVVSRHPQSGNGIAFVDFEGHAAEVLLNRYLDGIAT